jgi:DnaJ-class molecular chaperone
MHKRIPPKEYRNFYEFMQLSETATVAEIGSKRRHFLAILHTDVTRTTDTDDAKQKREIVTSVCEFLLDPVKRAFYDTMVSYFPSDTRFRFSGLQSIVGKIDRICDRMSRGISRAKPATRRAPIPPQRTRGGTAYSCGATHYARSRRSRSSRTAS